MILCVPVQITPIDRLTASTCRHVSEFAEAQRNMMSEDALAASSQSLGIRYSSSASSVISLTIGSASEIAWPSSN